MPRKLIAAAVVAAAWLAPVAAWDGDGAAPGADLEPAAPVEPGADVVDDDAEPPATQEIGGALGLAAGGRVTPGGVHVDGVYLYRLSDQDWFVGGIGFTVGGGAAGCFRDRNNDTICDHGVLQGADGELRAGVRRYLPGRQSFAPHAEAGVTLRLARYGDDHLTGVALPVWIGAGVRATVSPGIEVGGGARLEAGPALFGKHLGLEPQLGLVVTVGCDFAID